MLFISPAGIVVSCVQRRLIDFEILQSTGAVQSFFLTGSCDGCPPKKLTIDVANRQWLSRQPSGLANTMDLNKLFIEMKLLWFMILCGSITAGTARHADGGVPVITGVNLFIEACNWNGNNPEMIRSGYAEFELTVTEGSQSEADIQHEINQALIEHRKIIDVADKTLKGTLERALKQIPDTIRAAKLGGRRSRIKVLLNGNDTLGKRRFEVINFDTLNSKWDEPTIALRRNAKKDGGDNILWEQARQTALLTRTNFGADDFLPFGRMRGSTAQMFWAALGGSRKSDGEFSPDAVEAFKTEFARITSNAEADVLQLVGEVKYDRDAAAYVVETTQKKGSAIPVVLQRYWIDAARGYICPLIQLFDDKGVLGMEWKASDFFLHKESGLWFPASYISTEYIPGTHTLRERREYHLDEKVLQINQKVADEEFAVTIPADADILDARNAVQVNYRATEPFTLSFAEESLDLGSKPIMRAGAPSKPIGIALPTNRMLLVLVNIIIVVGLIGALWWRKWHKARIGSVLFLSCLLGGGCTQANQPATGKLGELVIEPPILDFGRVRQLDTPVELSFAIINNGIRPLRIAGISSGCGCTTADLADPVVPANGRISVPVKINLFGRSGSFANRVAVAVAGRNEPFAVPIQGTVVTDIWYSGQPVQCSATGPGPEGKFEGTFDVSTIDWPAIEFDWRALQKGTQVKEISRSEKAGETVIKFHFVIDESTEDQYATTRYITLQPLIHHIKPLKIPVVCYRPDLKNTVKTPELTPLRIGLGVIRPGEGREFELFGELSLIDSLSIAEWIGMPDGSVVTLDPTQREGRCSRTVRIRLGTSANSGLFQGQIRLKTSGNRLFPIVVLGNVRLS